MTTQISADNIQAQTLENLGGAPTVTQVQVCDSSFIVLDDTAVGLSGGFIRILGTRFVAGCQVLIDQVPATSVTFVSSGELQVVVPALVAGTYILYVANTDGSTAIRVNGLTASEAPAWISDSTLIGDAGAAISIQLSAAGAVSYSLAAGSTLPEGLTLSSSGLLSGTVNTETETVYNFVVDAIDLELQDSPRSFAITISVGDPQFASVVTLLSPDLEVLPFNRDSSTNNFAVSVLGDTRPNNFGPYTPGYYSNYFGGEGNYLRYTGGGTTTLPGDFTIEAWIYLDSIGSSQAIFNIGNSGTTGLEIAVNSVGDVVFLSATNIFGSGTRLVSRTWYHIAVVRSGSTLTTYINGITHSTGTVSSTFEGTTTNIGQSNSLPYSGYISNLRLVKDTAVYTSNFTPPTTPLTAITGTSLLTCQSNRFIDNSANNFAITRTGNVRINGFVPFVPSTEFAGRGSTYFDGSGDYLDSATSSAFTYGTGDFTIEFWAYFTAISGSTPNLIDQRGGTHPSPRPTIFMDGGVLRYYTAGAARISGPSLVANVWYHIALCRNSGTTRLFVNGTQVGASFADTTNYTSTKVRVFASDDGSPVAQAGYCSNLRIVNGTALYTADFAPPTAPLTAVTNTSLLTCQTSQPHNNNQFLDSSTNNFLVTRFGNTTQGASSPYGGGWSNYFDGSGDYLTVPNNAALQMESGNFTIEFWINFSSITGFQSVYDKGYTSAGSLLFQTGNGNGRMIIYAAGSAVITESGTASIGTWTHYALVRSGSTLTLYRDGTSSGSATNSTNFNNATNLAIGASGAAGSGGLGSLPITGYISNVRVVKGTAVYTANFTPPTAPLDPIAGTSLLTCADNRFIDDSPNNLAITRAGDVSVQKFNPFGIQTAATPVSHSAFFDGTGDYLQLSTSTAVNITGNFTLEAWVYYTGASYSSYNDIVILSGNGINWGLLTNNGNLRFYGPTTTGVQLPRNTWVHVAAVRNSGVIITYVNGTQVEQTNYSNNLGYANITVGSWNTPAEFWTGYISNLRLVNGTAVYTADFTPSTAPLTAIANTSLLTCQSPTFVDNSSNRSAITAAGDARPSQTNPFGFTAGAKTSYTPQVYGGSAYFDGTGDWLTLPVNAGTAPGASDFTLEAWVNLSTLKDYQVVYDNRATGASSTGLALGVDTAGKAYLFTNNAFRILSTTVISSNVWNHIALVRSGSNISLYTNGVLGGTFSSSANFSDTNTGIGIALTFTPTSQFFGNISNLRLVKGTAVYTSSFVPPTAPLEPITNTTLMLNGTAAAIRNASVGNNLETVGDAKISTSVVKYGNTSINFPSTESWLKIPNSDAGVFGTGNFTVEMWVFFPENLASSGRLIAFTSSATPAAGRLQQDSGNSLYWIDASNLGGFGTGARISVSLSTWTHIAICRSGTTLRYFKDGVQVASGSDTSNYTVRSISVGADHAGSWRLTCSISDLRITKGHARYTANFTPTPGAHKTK